MNKTKMPKGIAIDIQAVDMTLTENLQRRIFEMLEKFQRYFSRINWADFYIRQLPKRSAAPRSIKVRLGIAGQDIVVADKGRSWKSLMGRVEEKIIRQLRRRKMMAPA